jgi:hypothetical protein
VRLDVVGSYDMGGEDFSAGDAREQRGAQKGAPKQAGA